MLKGPFYSTVKFFPIVTCCMCCTEAMTDSVTVTVKTNSLSAIGGAIKNQLKGKLIQPPIDWSVNGRDTAGDLIFICPICGKKS